MLPTRSMMSCIVIREKKFMANLDRQRWEWKCHIAVRLSCLGICLVNFLFYFESNSPLVSGHLPFLLCPWSDVIPNP